MHVLPLYLPPVLVPAFLAWVFGQTLLPGRTPLIEQLVQHAARPGRRAGACRARATRGASPAYGPCCSSRWRLRTWCWRRSPSPMACCWPAAITPPVTVPQEWWSLFANLIAYLIVVAFFADRVRLPAAPLPAPALSQHARVRTTPARGHARDCSDARRDERRSRCTAPPCASPRRIRRSPGIFPGGRSCPASCCSTVCWTKPNAGSDVRCRFARCRRRNSSAPLLPEQSAELELRLAGDELRFSVTRERRWSTQGLFTIAAPPLIRTRSVKQEWIDRPEGGTAFGYKLVQPFRARLRAHGGAPRALSDHAVLPDPARPGTARLARVSAADQRSQGDAVAGGAAHPLLRGRHARSRVPAVGALQALRHPHLRSRRAAAARGRRAAAC